MSRSSFSPEWTDGWTIYFVDPLVVRCGSCHNFYWPHELDYIGTLDNDPEDPPEWYQAKHYECPTKEEHLEALAQKVYQTPTQELYLRMRIWRENTPRDLSPEITRWTIPKHLKENLERLTQLVDPWDQEWRLMHVEMYRQLGCFDDALTILRRYVSLYERPAADFQRKLCLEKNNTIQKWPEPPKKLFQLSKIPIQEILRGLRSTSHLAVEPAQDQRLHHALQLHEEALALPHEARDTQLKQVSEMYKAYLKKVEALEQEPLEEILECKRAIQEPARPTVQSNLWHQARPAVEHDIERCLDALSKGSFGTTEINLVSGEKERNILSIFGYEKGYVFCVFAFSAREPADNLWIATSTEGKGEDSTINIFGQKLDVSPRHKVSIEAAYFAALYLIKHQKRTPDLEWEERGHFP